MLTIANPKTRKGEKSGYLTGILMMLPANYSGFGNVCPDHSPGCSSTCLAFSGRGVMSPIIAARQRKNQMLHEARKFFLEEVCNDIHRLEKKALRAGLIPAVRLNGLSDLPWENMIYMNAFPKVQFYDYTKSLQRMHKYFRQHSQWPLNYHLTFSRSETNRQACKDVLFCGGNVAVVFDKVPTIFPNTVVTIPDIGTCRVINGDENDLRFLDPTPVIVALKAKGKAKKDTTGFVVRNAIWE